MLTALVAGSSQLSLILIWPGTASSSSGASGASELMVRVLVTGGESLPAALEACAESV